MELRAGFLPAIEEQQAEELNESYSHEEVKRSLRDQVEGMEGAAKTAYQASCRQNCEAVATRLSETAFGGDKVRVQRLWDSGVIAEIVLSTSTVC